MSVQRNLTDRIDAQEEHKMQQMEVDSNVERPGVEELVVVGAAGKLVQSFVDASLGTALTPITLIKMGHHMRLLHGRYFFLKSSQLAKQYLDSHDYNDIVADTELTNAVSNYHSYVNAHLIKKSLQMHPFYSTYSAGLFKRRRKNNETLKSLESVFDTAEKLSESVKKQKELYGNYLERNSLYPEFYNRCLTEIDDHKGTLKQQNIDKETKVKVAKKKSEVKFLAEISARLLAITLLEDPDLVHVLIDVTDVLGQVL